MRPAEDDGVGAQAGQACRFDFPAGWVRRPPAEAAADGTALRATYYGRDRVPLLELRVDHRPDAAESVESVSSAATSTVALLLASTQDRPGVRVANEPEVTRLDLPAGPAVRVRALLSVRRFLGLGRRLSQSVQFAVFPPGSEGFVVVAFTWDAIGRSHELAELADELMVTFRTA
ncbi:hypothetical protein ACFWNK_20530 [Streptomyces sp. NPDC058417]|uniref:hypothetical protein n=1 Tax=unclassified Streptomyces TaxID=2593676 RepID=UPI00365C03ED